MFKCIAINVGVNNNPKWGGFRGPIFSDGSFKFIHIPWKEKYGRIEPLPKKYTDMPYGSYVPEYVKKIYEHVLISPDFDNCTYASTTGALANKSILDLGSGDYLLFYATLKFEGSEENRESWINPNWGAYIIGKFKIDSIYPSLRRVLTNEAAIKAFKDYAWFKSLVSLGARDDQAPWVKGVKGESGLFTKAIPLSSPEDPQKWSSFACEFFRTTKGNPLNPTKKAIYQTVLTCKAELCLDKPLAR